MQKESNLPSKTQESYAFIVLLHDIDDAKGLAELLEDVRLPESSTPTAFVVPEVRSVNFFESRSTGQLDEWWASNVPPAALPVYLLEHEKELATWLNGLQGIFYIGVPNQLMEEEYEKSAQIRTFPSSGPLDFATIVMRDFSGKKESGTNIFDEGEALRMAALAGDLPLYSDVESSPSYSPFGSPPSYSPFGSPPSYSPFGSPPLYRSTVPLSSTGHFLRRLHVKSMVIRS